ncbi:MAG: hypothetical protein ACI8TX_001650 [Hyphomicrobiaceae bacterium]|jgi:hypothetical protein
MDSHNQRMQALMLGNGFAVMIIGMLSGFMLTFSLLEAIDLWPIPAIPVTIPGTTRGWVAAHTGNIMNGLMVVAVALALPRLNLSGRRLAWVGWGLIATAWGNACFYVFGNLAANRALTIGDNRFGESSLAGLLGVVPALVAAVLVLIALSIAMRAAFRAAAGSE